MNKKLFITLAAGALMLTSAAAGAYGATNLQAIKANLNLGLQFKLNGKSWTPTDYPITYNGKTYLPLRAVGEALEIEVGWDPKNNTVWLGEGAMQAGEGKQNVEAVDFEVLYDFTLLFNVDGKRYLPMYSIHGQAIDSSGKLYVDFFPSGQAFTTFVSIAENSFVIDAATDNPFIDGYIRQDFKKTQDFIKDETKYFSASQFYVETTYTNPSNEKKYVISTNVKDPIGSIFKERKQWIPVTEALNALGYKITIEKINSEKILLVSITK